MATLKKELEQPPQLRSNRGEVLANGAWAWGWALRCEILTREGYVNTNLNTSTRFEIFQRAPGLRLEVLKYVKKSIEAPKTCRVATRVLRVDNGDLIPEGLPGLPGLALFAWLHFDDGNAAAVTESVCAHSYYSS